VLTCKSGTGPSCRQIKPNKKTALATTAACFQTRLRRIKI
jgi:hypothetical protein